jgi:acyl-coenzyme A synthetase/AMP-(fatty) acid ligase
VTLGKSRVRAYRTGDIAYENAQGNLVYCGRLDSQVKIDGHRIELGEIEYFARRFIGSSTAAVVVTRDNLGAQELKLFVGGSNIDRPGLEECLRENLPQYMLPSSTILLPELPLNLNGKIDRPALERMATE